MGWIGRPLEVRGWCQWVEAVSWMGVDSWLGVSGSQVPDTSTRVYLFHSFIVFYLWVVVNVQGYNRFLVGHIVSDDLR